MIAFFWENIISGLLPLAIIWMAKKNMGVSSSSVNSSLPWPTRKKHSLFSTYFSDKHATQYDVSSLKQKTDTANNKRWVWENLTGLARRTSTAKINLDYFWGLALKPLHGLVNLRTRFFTRVNEITISRRNDGTESQKPEYHQPERFKTRIFNRELFLFLIGTIFILGECLESVFFFFQTTSFDLLTTTILWNGTAGGHIWEQETYLFSLPNTLETNANLPSWEVAIGGDGISELLNLLLNFLSIVLLLLPGDSLEDNITQSSIFIFFQTLLAVCFSVLDLLVFFVFFELLLVPMFLFFLFYSARERRVRAYWYFFFYTALGSVPFLCGIFYLQSLVGTLNFNAIEAQSLTISDQTYLWCLFLPAIIFKLPLCPFHLWLPEAHVEAPTAISVFLAGILLKIGGYAYIRFLMGFTPLANINFLDVIYSITLASCVWSSLAAMFQTDLKRLVAYMSISHMSLAILVLNTLTLAGFYSAVYTFLGHGLTSSALFILVGILYDRYKVRHINYYAGIQSVMPLFSTYLTFFIFCNIGFPGSPGFVSELLAFFSLVAISYTSLILVFFSVFILVFINLWFLRILYGPASTNIIKETTDVNVNSGEHASLILLVVATLLLGIYPQIFFNVINADAVFYLLRENPLI